MGCPIFAAILLSLPFSASGQEVRHSVFIAGPDFTGIIDENGEPIWDTKRKGARDGWVLGNGNVLIAWTNEVLEYKKGTLETVFRYPLIRSIGKSGRSKTRSGRTLITELGTKPRLLEVDAAGTIVIEVPLLPETENAHMQTRAWPENSRKATTSCRTCLPSK